ncbi:MAG: type IV secretion system protein [Proteobacteria bacterium]|nr:type IV secretion system protein [Pseudomonadota bacterium]
MAQSRVLKKMQQKVKRRKPQKVWLIKMTTKQDGQKAKGITMQNIRLSMRALYLVVSFLASLFAFIATEAMAAGVYDSCVYSYEFGATSRVKMLVYPIGYNCYTTCATECTKLFAKQAADGGWLNLDIISQCRAACQKGDQFTAKYRIPTAPQPFTMNQWTLAPAATLSAGCSKDPTNINSAAYNYYDTGILTGPDNKIQLKINMATYNFSNALYMCGAQTVDIYPSFYSIDPNIWQQHTQSWAVTPQDPNDTTPINSWNARNPYWTDTGIKVQDNDYLAIMYGGPYIQNCSNASCDPDLESDDLDINSGANGVVTGSTQVLPGSQLLITNAPDCTTLSTAADVNACLASVSNSSITPGQIVQNNDNVKIMGLMGSAVGAITSLGIEPIPNKPIFKIATFAGIAKGFSAMPANLLIRHHDTGATNKWANNVGGKHVIVTWQGCPLNNGDGLQYAIVPPDQSTGTGLGTTIPTYTPKDSSNWQSIDSDAIPYGKTIQLDSSTAGKVYFRVKPMGQWTDSVNNSIDARQAVGQYAFDLSVTDQNQGSIMGYIYAMIKTISAYFFGEDGTSGVARTIFVEMLGNSALVTAIKALLVLYITFTGFSFMIGTAQMSHQEVIIRVMKISIVLVLLNDGWNFCNTYLFPLFTSGMLEIMTLVYSDPDVDPGALARFRDGDPFAIFYNMDKPIGQMLFGPSGTGIKGSGLLGGPTWHKVQALCMSSLFGPLLGAAIIVGCVFYAMAIFKSIMVFLLSLIGIAVMMMTAPLFISLILFAKTREIFDSWIKLLMSFSFQPIMVFAMLGVMGKLMLMTFYVSLWFTACEACYIRVTMKVFNYDACWANAYFTLNYAHSTGYLDAPISSLGVVFAFLLVAIGTYSMIDVMCSLATQIITGAYYGVHLGGMAVQANPFTKAASMFEAIMGSAIQGPMAKRREALVKAGEKADAKKRELEDRKDLEALMKYDKAKGKYKSAEDKLESGKDAAKAEKEAWEQKFAAKAASKHFDYQQKMDSYELDKRTAYSDAINKANKKNLTGKAYDAYVERKTEERLAEIQRKQSKLHNEYEAQTRETLEEGTKERARIDKKQAAYIEKLEKKVEERKEEFAEREAELKEQNKEFMTQEELKEKSEKDTKKKADIAKSLDQKKKEDEEFEDDD